MGGQRGGSDPPPTLCPPPQFAVLLSLIFLVEIAAAIAGYVFKDKVGAGSAGAAGSGPHGRGVRVAGGHVAGPLAEPGAPQFHCCGINNYTDWANVAPFKGNDTVPRSCCRVNSTTCNVHPSPGCVSSLEAWMKKNIVVVAAVALGIAFFEVLGIIFACCLMRGIRSGYEVM
uniref:CD63 molecule n=1 Tax=Nothoprocta perdicaria TaxID=30464 RepID=A0A8C6YT21_NOTPE